LGFVIANKKLKHGWCRNKNKLSALNLSKIDDMIKICPIFPRIPAVNCQNLKPKQIAGFILDIRNKIPVPNTGNRVL
jgi:hypothetical protein